MLSLTVTLPNEQRIAIPEVVLWWLRRQEFALENLAVESHPHARLQHYVKRLPKKTVEIVLMSSNRSMWLRFTIFLVIAICTAPLNCGRVVSCFRQTTPHRTRLASAFPMRCTVPPSCNGRSTSATAASPLSTFRGTTGTREVWFLREIFNGAPFSFEENLAAFKLVFAGSRLPRPRSLLDRDRRQHVLDDVATAEEVRGHHIRMHHVARPAAQYQDLIPDVLDGIEEFDRLNPLSVIALFGRLCSENRGRKPRGARTDHCNIMPIVMCRH